MGYLGPVPVSALIALVVVDLNILLTRTIFDAGSAPSAATRRRRVHRGSTSKILAFTLSGAWRASRRFCSCRSSSAASPRPEQGYELYAIAAVDIGGTSRSAAPAVSSAASSARSSLLAVLLGEVLSAAEAASQGFGTPFPLPRWFLRGKGRSDPAPALGALTTCCKIGRHETPDASALPMKARPRLALTVLGADGVLRHGSGVSEALPGSESGVEHEQEAMARDGSL